MKAFWHDTNASNDARIIMLVHRFGYEGTGLYWAAIEMLADHEKPIEEDAIKIRLKVGKRLQPCWDYLKETGLLFSENSRIFSRRIGEEITKYQEKSIKNKIKVKNWRNSKSENQQITENVTGYETVTNQDVTVVDKIRIDKNIKKEESNINITKEEKSKDSPISPEFLKFKNWINENAPRVNQMKEPFTEKQFLKIKKEFPDSALVEDKLRAMHSRADLLKKYVDAYGVCRNWCRMEKNKPINGNHSTGIEKNYNAGLLNLNFKQPE